MISKAQTALVKSLDQKKYRNEYKLFFVEGIKIVNELLISEFKLHSLFALKEWISENKEKCAGIENKINEVSPDELKKISCLSTPNQVLAIFKIPEMFEDETVNSMISIYLDKIRDPGNLGTIIRLADWYGIPNIICSSDSVDAFNPKVVQSAMGSISRVKVLYTDLEAHISKNRNIFLYAAVKGGNNLHNSKLKFPAAIIIGNESQGISTQLMKYCEATIGIPGYGGAESLNASVATAIIIDRFKLESNKQTKGMET